MSKNRSISLASKWKLGKALKDYQDNRAARKQSGLGYLEPLVASYRKKKKAPNYCSRLKGEHDYEIKEINKYAFFISRKRVTVYVCKGCGKEKIEWHHNKEETEQGSEGSDRDSSSLV